MSSSTIPSPCDPGWRNGSSASRDLLHRLDQERLQLDNLGTEVWKMIDGKRTVRDIVDAFAETHQLEGREAEMAVTQFLRDLGKRGLIGLQE